MAIDETVIDFANLRLRMFDVGSEINDIKVLYAYNTVLYQIVSYHIIHYIDITCH